MAHQVHNTNITTAETWAGTDTHEVTASIAILAGGSLVIEPGAFVYPTGGARTITYDGGLLTAEGTEDNKIVLGPDPAGYEGQTNSLQFAAIGNDVGKASVFKYIDAYYTDRKSVV